MSLQVHEQERLVTQRYGPRAPETVETHGCRVQTDFDWHPGLGSASGHRCCARILLASMLASKSKYGTC